MWIMKLTNLGQMDISRHQETTCKNNVIISRIVIHILPKLHL